MIIDLRRAIMNRACAALGDPRAAALGRAFRLQPGAAWILARMEEEPAALTRSAIQRRPRSKFAILRHVQATGPLIEEIAQALGGRDAILTEPEGYRLTPLGRIRIRKALKEPII
ncbi:hypothetical protein JIX58_07090 [Brevundimonas diminuta]|uniref:hypothetical protein n=1 Tax=Brevundimonas diminuta TaxID=293 RepID=UPI001907B0A1|nr:hypothetical protein [Brevundimonas diminuta]MBK1969417.1 hypothetical protein [Brevundimonas diminuta]MBK1975508.1 hypothetical protein [Brevundimonas diminuta]